MSLPNILYPYALGEIIVCWILWFFAFAGPRRLAAGQKKVVEAPASKWGIVMQMVGYGLIWVYVRPEGFEKPTWSLVFSMILAPFSVAVAWMAARNLGRQWRFEAALIEGHELVQTGPYRWVRHPIYFSMLCMVVSVGCVRTWWPLFTAAVILFVAGTEIRVRAEDGLLSEHFREKFAAYRSRVPAYIPFIR